MSPPVKQPKKRRYESPRRREQAAATRDEILDAARRLFERQGYAATTMDAIAAEAGVALKTVYLAFETKSGLLRALWHRLLRGEQDEIPVDEQPWFREVIEEPDPERQLRMSAKNSRMVKVRAAALLEVLRNATWADRDIADLWDRIQKDFHRNQRAIVQSLDEKDALRPDLDVDRAADVMWTVNHPNVWQLLVIERGWSPDQYEVWLGDTFRSQLLASSR